MRSWWPASIIVAAAAASLFLPAQASAQDSYPSRAITIVVPGAAGGGLDRVARLVAEKFRVKWGQPVIIENRGGAGGMIGTEHVANSAPDGYTILYAGTGHIAIDKGLKLSYDPDGWVPISLVTTAPNILVVHPDVKANSVQELIAASKAKAGGLNYASQGIGTTQHLSVEWLKSLAGAEMVHVPFGGGAPGLTALLSGQVDLMFTEISGVIAHIRAGKLRPLAAGGTTRDPLLPDVPAMNEIYPGFVSMTWQAFVAPKGTPKDIAAKLAAATAEALKSPDIVASLKQSSLNSIASTPDELATFVKEERARWSGVIRSAGIKFQN